MDKDIIDQIDRELVRVFGDEFVGYSGADVLSEGEVPKGSVLPPPDSGKVYMRDFDNRGWLLVPSEWTKTKSPVFTDGRNPATGREEPQLTPPGISGRGKHYGQPWYTDGEAYGGTGGMLRVAKAPVKSRPRSFVSDPPAPASPTAPSELPVSSAITPFASSVKKDAISVPDESKNRWIFVPIAIAVLAALYAVFRGDR